MKKRIKGISGLLTVCLLLSISGISALAETPPEDKMVTKEPKPESVEVDVAVNTPEAPAAEGSVAGRTVTDEVEIGDGMTVSAAGGNAAGIQTAASAGGQIDLLIQGDTGVSSDSGASTGIAASADSTSGVAIVIEGDLSTKG